MELKATEYLIVGEENVTVARRLGRGGKELWCIFRWDRVFNKDNEWEYEPLPSARDEEFIARTRWNSAEDAASFYCARKKE